MSTIAELLEEQAPGLTEPELVAAVRELLGPPPRPAEFSPLTAHDQAYLREHGGLPAITPERVAGARARRLARTTAFVTESLSTAEVAGRLGVDPSRIRHMSADGALYAMRTGRQNRYPSWQFGDDGRPLPGLRAVLQALPPGLHPLEVRGFMTTPQPDYAVRGRELTPIQWLAAGGDPAVVADLARWVAADR